MYIAIADFRSGTQTWYTRKLPGLPWTTGDVPDADLTAAIGAASDWIDRECDDHFEEEDPLTINVDGSGLQKLYLPKRCQSVTSVSTLNTDGINYTVQTSTTYALVSSLDSSGNEFSGLHDLDYLVIPGGQYLNVWGSGQVWPQGVSNVRVVGKFSWNATPERIKRAVALKVWDALTGVNPSLLRADRYTSDVGTFDMAPIVEVSEIVNEYKRRTWAAVA